MSIQVGELVAIRHASDKEGFIGDMKTSRVESRRTTHMSKVIRVYSDNWVMVESGDIWHVKRVDHVNHGKYVYPNCLRTTAYCGRSRH